MWMYGVVQFGVALGDRCMFVLKKKADCTFDVAFNDLFKSVALS